MRSGRTKPWIGTIAAAAPLVLAACQGSSARVEPIGVEEIAAHIRYLSDDLLEGRAVGTEGIEKAARYHEDYFRALGLEPAFGESYRQTFPLRGSRPDPLATLEIAGPEAAFAPALWDEFVVRTEREDAPAAASGELVYCGYLIRAPERDWDDIKGTDLSGKVLLVEINEPGNRPGGIFDGEDMTYYGRWVCKFEQAAALGAAGVLIIHDDKGAAYGWDVLRASWGNESFCLPDRASRLLFEGWVHGDTARRVLASARLDRTALRQRAERPDFAPVPLGLTATVRQKREVRTVEGVNVAGIVRAGHPAARRRTIVLSAHYDHFGRDEALEGDQIYNGAVDNCAASAALLALAGFSARRPETLKDDLCFVAVTAEEQVVLGSDYFVRHLPFPAESVVADINFEMTNVWGETEDAFAIGAKYSDLDGICREAAGRVGLRYIPERNGELGFFFRSDQLSFAKAGIPGVWLHQGLVAKGPDKDRVQRAFEEYRRTKYHKVTDEIQPDWDLRGALQIIGWAREIVTILQETETLPRFLPTSSFRRPEVPPAVAAEIHEAVRVGDLDKVRGLLDGSPGAVDAADAIGQTPLHLAAASGNVALVDLLLSRGADIRALCRDGRNLLHSAASGGLVGLMERLVREGFPVDGPDRYGRTPLLRAAQAGSVRAAEFLIARGADVKSRDYYKQTPLHEAAFEGDLRLMDLLVRHGAEVDALNEEGSTPLLYISQAGKAEAIEWLLEHGARLDVRNKFNETVLTFPLGNGFQDLVSGLWPRAEALGDRDLLEKYPLHRVAYLGLPQAAAFVLGKGVPIGLKDESGRLPIHRAAQGGSVELVRMLLDRGARIDALDDEGATPLHLAAKKGRAEVVRFLLEKGAEAGAQDGQGRTPLELARIYDYPEIAGILEAAGAKPTPGRKLETVASLLARPLDEGEAIVWSLGHCGFAVKTRSRLLIFDYFSRGWPRPDPASLANGFVDPEEIKDLDVVVFVSHAHGDHFDPAILSWRPVVRSIGYVFGWNARQGERTVDLAGPRATAALGGMEVYTVNDEHDDVPEVAFLVKIDGLAVYHSGDYMGALDAYPNDMAYLLEKAGTVDLAFIEKVGQAASLKPRVVIPIHAYNREYFYGAFAREAASLGLPSRVVCPENKGDRFELRR